LYNNIRNYLKDYLEDICRVRNVYIQSIDIICIPEEIENCSGHVGKAFRRLLLVGKVIDLKKSFKSRPLIPSIKNDVSTAR
jgi:hypothetical protein